MRHLDALPPIPQRLPRPVADAHTHMLSTQAFSGLTVADAIERAEAVNVTHFVEVGVDAESSREAVALAGTHPQVVANVALHPNEAARRTDDLAAEFAKIEALASQPGVRGVGETGLDYFRTTDAAGQRRQRESFVSHIRLAVREDLTLVIHDRDAHDDVLAVLDDVGLPPRIVMHCFSGDVDFAEACVERGAWLSFPGTVTFNANHALREAAVAVPPDRLLVETDAPYLTPVPSRGKPNSSYLIAHTVRFLAELRGDDLSAFCDKMTANTQAAFGGSWGNG